MHRARSRSKPQKESGGSPKGAAVQCHHSSGDVTQSLVAALILQGLARTSEPASFPKIISFLSCPIPVFCMESIKWLQGHPPTRRALPQPSEQLGHNKGGSKLRTPFPRKHPACMASSPDPPCLADIRLRTAHNQPHGSAASPLPKPPDLPHSQPSALRLLHQGCREGPRPMAGVPHRQHPLLINPASPTETQGGGVGGGLPLLSASLLPNVVPCLLFCPARGGGLPCPHPPTAMGVFRAGTTPQRALGSPGHLLSLKMIAGTPYSGTTVLPAPLLTPHLPMAPTLTHLSSPRTAWMRAGTQGGPHRPDPPSCPFTSLPSVLPSMAGAPRCPSSS